MTGTGHPTGMPFKINLGAGQNGLARPDFARHRPAETLSFESKERIAKKLHAALSSVDSNIVVFLARNPTPGLVKKAVCANKVKWGLIERGYSKDVVAQEETKKAWAKEGLDDGRGWVEIDAKVSHDTLRKERAKGRTAEVGFWFGTAFLVLLGGYGFLRLDMWTKGYLTLVLGLVVGAAAVGGVVALGLLVF